MKLLYLFTFLKLDYHTVTHYNNLLVRDFSVSLAQLLSQSWSIKSQGLEHLWQSIQGKKS